MGSAASDFKGLTSPRSGDKGQSPTKSPFGGLYNDPRSSSTQSLTPSLPEYEEIERRRLLVIYIHGFMGNDTSFQSFPAHVHGYLKLALSDSHVVHSKIYPRYKTYKSIEVARDNFSAWLEPLENSKTDVILVGHSMGGLLAADVVLKQPTYQNQHQHHNGYFKHRILGTVNLDSPLLGMHPGVIVSGISSLFRKNETPKLSGEPQTQSAVSPSITGLPSPNLSTYSSPSMISDLQPTPPPPPAPFVRPALTYDANYNPTFPNDVRMEERTWWKNVVHFVKKHNSEGLIDATANHIMSHLEFGGSMFDINTLKTRYESIRKLEDVDDLKQSGSSHMPPQVRFIQYYTICNGFPKTPKGDGIRDNSTRGNSTREGSMSSTPIHDDTEKALSSSLIPVDGPPNDEMPKQDLRPLSLSGSERSSLELLSPEPILDEPLLATGDKLNQFDGIVDTKPSDDHSSTAQANNRDSISSPTEKYPVEDKALTSEMTNAIAALDIDLPAIPELPPQPESLNLELYADKDARKLAEKEAKRAQRAYANAVKDREKAIRDREKIVEKRRRKLAQDAEKKAKDEKKNADKKARDEEKNAEKLAKDEEKKRRKEEAAAASKSPATETTEEKALLSPSSQDVSEKPAAPSDKATQLPPLEWTPESLDAALEGRAGKIGKEKSREKGIEEAKEEKKKMKQRKFCNVPKSHGQVDSKWVGVFMKDMDEVAAHTGLFFAGEHYESLVGDVGNTMVEWVQADMTKQTILGLQ